MAGLTDIDYRDKWRKELKYSIGDMVFRNAGGTNSNLYVSTLEDNQNNPPEVGNGWTIKTANPIGGVTPLPSANVMGQIPYYNTSINAWVSSPADEPNVGEVYTWTITGPNWIPLIGLPTASLLGQMPIYNPASGWGLSGGSPQNGYIPIWNGVSFSWSAIPSQIPAATTAGQIAIYNGSSWVISTAHAPQDGEVPIWGTGNFTWSAIPSQLPSAVDGQILGYNSGWTAITPVSLEVGTAAGQMLFWDGSKWAHTETTELYYNDTTKYLQIGPYTSAGGGIKITPSAYQTSFDLPTATYGIFATSGGSQYCFTGLGAAQMNEAMVVYRRGLLFQTGSDGAYTAYINMGTAYSNNQATSTLKILGQNQHSTATTYPSGGNIYLNAGDGASGSGAANGGNLYLRGGRGYGTGTTGTINFPDYTSSTERDVVVLAPYWGNTNKTDASRAGRFDINIIDYNATRTPIRIDATGTGATVKIGEASGSNYTQAGADGTITFVGTSRIDWAKITANSITLTAGTSTSALADLQTFGDGAFYSITEAAATPGIDFITDFISVTAFNWVRIKASYAGSATHSIGVQLYNWAQSRWDTFDQLISTAYDISTASGYIIGSHDFFIPSDTDYIGTGGNAGKVRVRFYHTMAGNPAHSLAIDVVALYQ